MRKEQEQRILSDQAIESKIQCIQNDTAGRLAKLEALVTLSSTSASAPAPPAAQENKPLDTLSPAAPSAELVKEYQAAFQSNDRDALRRIMLNELNIIDESENA